MHPRIRRSTAILVMIFTGFAVSNVVLTARSQVIEDPPPAVVDPPPRVVDPPPVVVDPPPVSPPGVPPITQPAPTPPRVVRPAPRSPVETGPEIEPGDVPPGIAITVTGRVEDTADAKVSVTETSTRKTWSFGAAPDAEILLNGKRATLIELAKGDAVRVTTLVDDRTLASRIVAARAEEQERTPPAAQVRAEPQTPVRRPLPEGRDYAGLGVHVADSPQGVFVVEIDHGSPADGVVRHGDFIMHYDRRQVTTPHVLLGWIQQQKPGEVALLGLWRLGREFNQPITLAHAHAARDLVVEDPALNLLLAQQVRTDSHLGLVLRETAGGVQVVSVAPDSPAAQLGLRQGSVISNINGRPIDTPFQFYREFWTVGPQPGFLDLGLADGGTRRLDLSQLDGFLENIRNRRDGSSGTGAIQQPGVQQPGRTNDPSRGTQPQRPDVPKIPTDLDPIGPIQPGQPAPRPGGAGQPGQPTPGRQSPGQAAPAQPGAAQQPGGGAQPAQGTNPFRAGDGQP
ncbi:MAG: PDZ domain-containing protein [Planctomycetaceae bacterium]